MKYIKSTNYVSPLSVLLKRIEHLKVMTDYEQLECYVQAIIALDYEKFVTPLILENFEKELKEHLLHYHFYDSYQYELCYEENLAGQNEIKTKIRKQKNKLKQCIDNVQRHKLLIKSNYPNLWTMFLEVKKEYGIIRHKTHEDITGYLKGLTNPLLDYLSVFVGKHSFPVNSFVSSSNKDYKLIRSYHEILGIDERKRFLTRKELKAMPVTTLIHAVKLIQEETQNITKNDIYNARNNETMHSYKKQYERYGMSFDKGKWILEWWENIIELDPNYKLILI